MREMAKREIQILEEVEENRVRLEKVDLPEKYAQAYLFRLMKQEKGQ